MEQQRLAVGGAIGRYEIIEHYATGGMAEVYLAQRQGIGGFQKTVILKTIRKEVIEDESFVRMFLDEARIAGSLNHANIAAVYEADDIDGVAFIIMEYVAGPPLSRLVKTAERARKVELPALARIIAGAARGLHHAHVATSGSSSPSGLVHRDVSLDNILVSKDGIAKVIDFGIAKARDRLTQTQTDVLKGKLGYMAPEQLESNGELDHRADVYSLGVCLYRATVGSLAFPQTTTPALLKARIQNTYVTPTEAVPGFPPELAAIIERAMAKEPSDRYGTAREMADALDAWVRSVDASYEDSRVGEWVKSVFPDEKMWRTRRRETQSTGGSGSLSGSGSTGSGRTPRTGAGATGGGTGGATTVLEPATGAHTGTTQVSNSVAAASAVVAGAAFLLVALVAIGGLALLWRGGVGAGGDPDARAVAYLDQAEKAEQQGDLSLAQRLVTDALGITGVGPDVAVRASTLDERVHREQKLVAAKAALDRGDTAVAIQQAREVLDSDPTNAEATDLLAKISGAASADAVKETIAVDSDPEGATVFVDDMPVGTTPLVQPIPVGHHVMHLRKLGFQTEEQTFDLAAGAPQTVALKLSASKDSSSSASSAKPSSSSSSSSSPTASTAPTVASTAPSTAVAAAVAPPVPATTVAPTAPPPTTTTVAPPTVAATTVTPAVAPPTAPAAPVVDVAAIRAALPARVQARTTEEAGATLSAVEKAAVKAGVPSAIASGATRTVADDLVANITPGSTMDIYARSLFDAIVAGNAQGLPAAKVRSSVARANHP